MIAITEGRRDPADNDPSLEQRRAAKMATREQRIAEIDFALKDIQATLAIWRDEKDHTDPYIVKLFAEFDALITEKGKIL